MEVCNQDLRISTVYVLDMSNEESCSSEEIREHNNSNKANQVQHVVKSKMCRLKQFIIFIDP